MKVGEQLSTLNSTPWAMTTCTFVHSNSLRASCAQLGQRACPHCTVHTVHTVHTSPHLLQQELLCTPNFGSVLGIDAYNVKAKRGQAEYDRRTREQVRERGERRGGGGVLVEAG